MVADLGAPFVGAASLNLHKVCRLSQAFHVNSLLLYLSYVHLEL